MIKRESVKAALHGPNREFAYGNDAYFCPINEEWGFKYFEQKEICEITYEAQKKALTPEGIVAIEVVKQIAEGKIKITPDFLIQGGSEGNNLMPLLSGVFANMLKSSLKTEIAEVKEDKKK